MEKGTIKIIGYKKKFDFVRNFHKFTSKEEVHAYLLKYYRCYVINKNMQRKVLYKGEYYIV